MKTFVAIVVGQGKKAFVQSLHVAADSSRRAAAIVLRQLRQSEIVDYQIALRVVEDHSFASRPGILMSSIPVQLGNPEPRVNARTLRR